MKNRGQPLFGKRCDLMFPRIPRFCADLAAPLVGVVTGKL